MFFINLLIVIPKFLEWAAAGAENATTTDSHIETAQNYTTVYSPIEKVVNEAVNEGRHHLDRDQMSEMILENEILHNFPLLEKKKAFGNRQGETFLDEGEFEGTSSESEGYEGDMEEQDGQSEEEEG